MVPVVGRGPRSRSRSRSSVAVTVPVSVLIPVTVLVPVMVPVASFGADAQILGQYLSHCVVLEVLARGFPGFAVALVHRGLASQLPDSGMTLDHAGQRPAEALHVLVDVARSPATHPSDGVARRARPRRAWPAPTSRPRPPSRSPRCRPAMFLRPGQARRPAEPRLGLPEQEQLAAGAARRRRCGCLGRSSRRGSRSSPRGSWSRRSRRQASAQRCARRSGSRSTRRLPWCGARSLLGGQGRRPGRSRVLRRRSRSPRRNSSRAHGRSGSDARRRGRTPC